MAIETTPLGFKKPDGNELVRGGDNVIADNAQKAQDVLAVHEARLANLDNAAGFTGDPLELNDAAVAAAVNGTGTATKAALTTAFVDRLGIPVSASDPRFGGLVLGQDNTAALDAAYAYAYAQGRALFIPSAKAGEWYYSGNGFSNGYVPILGEGVTRSRIRLAAGKYLFNVSTRMEYFYAKGLKVVGGAGFLKHSYTGDNVNGSFVIEDCVFTEYTGAAISTDSNDMPYWKIHRNIFWGSDFAATTGVALSGGTDLSEITGNMFFQNRVHVKVRGGTNTKIERNDFIRYGTARPSGPAIDVWLVPTASTATAAGTQIDDNKFGNENLVTGDYRILFADESGTTATINGQRFPALTADSIGEVANVSIEKNHISGANVAPTPFVYSTTTKTAGLTVGPLRVTGTPPTMLVQYRTPTNLDHGTILAGPIGSRDAGINVPVTPLSNSTGVYMTDPAVQQAQPRAVSQYTASDPGGVFPMLSAGNQPINTWFTYASTRASITDSMGGTDAGRVTFSETWGLIRQSLTALATDRLCWVEFDIKADPASPNKNVRVTIQKNDDTEYRLARWVLAGDNWRRIRIPYWGGAGAVGQVIVFAQAQGARGNVDIGRVRCYAAGEPQHWDTAIVSPDGQRWRLAVSNTGTLSTTLIP